MWNQSLWCLYGCNGEKLKDGEFISNLIVELARILDLRMIGRPTIDDFKEEGMTDAGVSVKVTIAEAKLYTSHFYIHTWPEIEYAAIDIFSCKEFNVEIAESFLMKKLGAIGCVRNDVKRGTYIGLKESGDKKRFPIPPKVKVSTSGNFNLLKSKV